MPDVVLLEWEGLLAETASLRAEALEGALRAEHVVAGYADDPVLADLVTARAERAFSARVAQGLVLTNGAGAFVERLQHRVRLGVVTQAARADTEQFLLQTGWEASFSPVVTADDTPDDSAEARIARAMALAGRRGALDPSRILVLGNSADAFRAARRAGVRTVAVGARAHVAVEAHGAVASLAGATLEDLAHVAGMESREQAR